MRTSVWIVCGLALALVACAPNAREDDGAGDDSSQGDDSTQPPPSARCDSMDIVFIVDDSPSMEEEQSNLGTNFPQFAQVLDQYEVEPGRPLDYRVALTTTGRTITTTVSVPPLPPITTTEMGDNGRFRNTCGVQRRWLERTDGNLSQTLSCRANVGIDGPSIEMPLYAAELALGDRVADGTNAGFLRDDALLAIVMLTDEDDCSRTDDNITLGTQDECAAGAASVLPARTIEFLDNLKGGRGRWATAVIAGPTDCTSAFGAAEAANKLKRFVTDTNTGGTSQNGIFSSICDGDLAPALQEALDTFRAACDSFEPIE